MRATIVEGFDRAAPLGVGNVKVAGNYAADLLPNQQMKSAGRSAALFPIFIFISHRMSQLF